MSSQQSLGTQSTPGTPLPPISSLKLDHSNGPSAIYPPLISNNYSQNQRQGDSTAGALELRREDSSLIQSDTSTPLSDTQTIARMILPDYNNYSNATAAGPGSFTDSTSHQTHNQSTNMGPGQSQPHQHHQSWSSQPVFHGMEAHHETPPQTTSQYGGYTVGNHHMASQYPPQYQQQHYQPQEQDTHEHQQQMIVPLDSNPNPAATQYHHHPQKHLGQGGNGPILPSSPLTSFTSHSSISPMSSTLSGISETSRLNLASFNLGGTIASNTVNERNNGYVSNNNSSSTTTTPTTVIQEGTGEVTSSSRQQQHHQHQHHQHQQQQHLSTTSPPALTRSVSTTSFTPGDSIDVGSIYNDRRQHLQSNPREYYVEQQQLYHQQQQAQAQQEQHQSHPQSQYTQSHQSTAGKTNPSIDTTFISAFGSPSLIANPSGPSTAASVGPSVPPAGYIVPSMITSPGVGPLMSQTHHQQQYTTAIPPTTGDSSSSSAAVVAAGAATTHGTRNTGYPSSSHQPSMYNDPTTQPNPSVAMSSNQEDVFEGILLPPSSHHGTPILSPSSSRLLFDSTAVGGGSVHISQHSRHESPLSYRDSFNVNSSHPPSVHESDVHIQPLLPPLNPLPSRSSSQQSTSHLYGVLDSPLSMSMSVSSTSSTKRRLQPDIYDITQPYHHSQPYQQQHQHQHQQTNHFPPQSPSIASQSSMASASSTPDRFTFTLGGDGHLPLSRQLNNTSPLPPSLSSTSSVSSISSTNTGLYGNSSLFPSQSLAYINEPSYPSHAHHGNNGAAFPSQQQIPSTSSHGIAQHNHGSTQQRSSSALSNQMGYSTLSSSLKPPAPLRVNTSHYDDDRSTVYHHHVRQKLHHSDDTFQQSPCVSLSPSSQSENTSTIYNFVTPQQQQQQIQPQTQESTPSKYNLRRRNMNVPSAAAAADGSTTSDFTLSSGNGGGGLNHHPSSSQGMLVSGSPAIEQHCGIRMVSGSSTPSRSKSKSSSSGSQKPSRVGNPNQLPSTRQPTAPISPSIPPDLLQIQAPLPIHAGHPVPSMYPVDVPPPRPAIPQQHAYMHTNDGAANISYHPHYLDNTSHGVPSNAAAGAANVPRVTTGLTSGATDIMGASALSSPPPPLPVPSPTAAAAAAGAASSSSLLDIIKNSTDIAPYRHLQLLEAKLRELYVPDDIFMTTNDISQFDPSLPVGYTYDHAMSDFTASKIGLSTDGMTINTRLTVIHYPHVLSPSYSPTSATTFSTSHTGGTQAPQVSPTANNGQDYSGGIAPLEEDEFIYVHTKTMPFFKTVIGGGRNYLSRQTASNPHGFTSVAQTRMVPYDPTARIANVRRLLFARWNGTKSNTKNPSRSSGTDPAKSSRSSSSASPAAPANVSIHTILDSALFRTVRTMWAFYRSQVSTHPLPRLARYVIEYSRIAEQLEENPEGIKPLHFGGGIRPLTDEEYFYIYAMRPVRTRRCPKLDPPPSKCNFYGRIQKDNPHGFRPDEINAINAAKRNNSRINTIYRYLTKRYAIKKHADGAVFDTWFTRRFPKSVSVSPGAVSGGKSSSSAYPTTSSEDTDVMNGMGDIDINSMNHDEDGLDEDLDPRKITTRDGYEECFDINIAIDLRQIHPNFHPSNSPYIVYPHQLTDTNTPSNLDRNYPQLVLHVRVPMLVKSDDTSNDPPPYLDHYPSNVLRHSDPSYKMKYRNLITKSSLPYHFLLHYYGFRSSASIDPTQLNHHLANSHGPWDVCIYNTMNEHFSSFIHPSMRILPPIHTNTMQSSSSSSSSSSSVLASTSLSPLSPTSSHKNIHTVVSLSPPHSPALPLRRLAALKSRTTQFLETSPLFYRDRPNMNVNYLTPIPFLDRLLVYILSMDKSLRSYSFRLFVDFLYYGASSGGIRPLDPYEFLFLMGYDPAEALHIFQTSKMAQVNSNTSTISPPNTRSMARGNHGSSNLKSSSSSDSSPSFRKYAWGYVKDIHPHNNPHGFNPTELAQIRAPLLPYLQYIDPSGLSSSIPPAPPPPVPISPSATSSSSATTTTNTSTHQSSLIPLSSSISPPPIVKCPFPIFNYGLIPHGAHFSTSTGLIDNALFCSNVWDTNQFHPVLPRYLHGFYRYTPRQSNHALLHDYISYKHVYYNPELQSYHHYHPLSVLSADPSIPLLDNPFRAKPCTSTSPPSDLGFMKSISPDTFEEFLVALWESFSITHQLLKKRWGNLRGPKIPKDSHDPKGYLRDESNEWIRQRLVNNYHRLPVVFNIYYGEYCTARQQYFANRQVNPDNPYLKFLPLPPSPLPAPLHPMGHINNRTAPMSSNPTNSGLPTPLSPSNQTVSMPPQSNDDISPSLSATTGPSHSIPHLSDPSSSNTMDDGDDDADGVSKLTPLEIEFENDMWCMLSIYPSVIPPAGILPSGPPPSALDKKKESWCNDDEAWYTKYHHTEHLVPFVQFCRRYQHYLEYCTQLPHFLLEDA